MAGYFMIRSTNVRDQAAFDDYSKLWKPIAERYGAKFIAGRGVRHETREGDDYPRNLIVEFASYEQAVACYDDPDYKVALELANKAYRRRELVIVESC